ncbi:hypothetical protein [Streptomyces sp. NPDC008137]
MSDPCPSLDEFVMSRRCHEVATLRDDETARLTRLPATTAAAGESLPG